MPATVDPVQKTAANTSDVLINAVKKAGPLDLAGLITREDTDLHVVSVCGTEGDLGKVVIVRKAYIDERVSKVFEFRAWVKIMHPFNPHKFIESLMTQFLTHSCQVQEDVIVGLDTLERMQQATQGGLIKEFAQKINTHRYIIVLEDLCTMVDWDAIRSYLPDRKKGSRIVVLTHRLEVASQCTGEPCRVSELGQFPTGHSIRVYYKQGFQPDRVQSISRKPTPQHSLFLGRDTEMDELLEKIQEIQLISVWGMPGVGKSALIKAIYDEKLRTGSQFKRQAWVNVSHPFNPIEFCRSLHESFSKGKYPKTLQAEDLINTCRDLLCEDVCLFVIDGVQSNEDWDWIKSYLIQFGNSGSCIIIITSEESVAKHCVVSIDDGVYNVKGLHATAVDQLLEKVLQEEEWGLNWQEVILLLSMCGGIPKVLVTVAGYMASKPKDEFQHEIRRLSANFMRELSTKPEFESLRGLLAWMHSYLDACPRHLKKYMLYLSIFPQDTIIRRRRLIRRWIAEGYSKGTDSNSMEKYAEKIFDEVAMLSIIHPVLLEASKVIGYRVNGFFREYIMSRPEEETMFLPVEVSALEKQGHGRLSTRGIGQHLAIGSTWETDWVLFESFDFSWLRSLTMFQQFQSFYVSDKMRVLRVLDLENAGGVSDSDFEQIGKLPSRLKFLSLRRQSNITHLPDSVGDLLQLQTLDIRDTSIVKLPPFITKLRKLQYIRAGTTVAWTQTPPSSSSIGGVEVPKGIKRLEALQTLGAIHVSTADGDAILDEISDYLPQLKKLEVSGIRNHRQEGFIWNPYDQNQRSVYSCLGSMGAGSLKTQKIHLESLSLQFERNDHSFHWRPIYIPKSIRSLKMFGNVEQLPHEMDHVVHLGKLTLELTNALFRVEVIEELGRLPSLLTLRLRVSEDQHHDELGFPTALFWRLQVLEIACSSKLHVKFDEGAMEKLEQLKFHCLQGSDMQFSGLEHPVSLKQVWLLGSFDDALKEAVQQQLDKHPKKPAPKLEVQPRSSQASRT